MGVFNEYIEGVAIGYKDITQILPFEFSLLFTVFLFAILISFYSIFAWKFYRHLSKKDLIKLNLKQYNRTQHPVLNKFVAILLYLVEYVIVLPFLILFWFSILAILILIMSEELTINQVVVVSAAIVIAIRMLSYYSENLSQELAKLFPFTMLVIFILTPSFFSVERIITNLTQIPELLQSIIYFFILIIGVELILRIIDTFANFFQSETE